MWVVILILLLAAVVFFVLAAIGVPERRFHYVGAGLACWCATALISHLAGVVPA